MLTRLARFFILGLARLKMSASFTTEICKVCIQTLHFEYW